MSLFSQRVPCRLALLLSCLVVGAVGEARAGLDSWQWRRPLPTAFNLLGIAQRPGLLVAVGHYGLIQTSTDGTSWTRRYSGLTNDLTEAAFGQDKIVAVGTYGAVLSSSNGLAWRPGNAGTWKHLGGIAYGNGQFVAFTLDYPYEILRSPDGQNWSFSPFTNGISLNQLRFCNGLFVGTGAYGIVTSNDGLSWNKATLTPSYSYLVRDAAFVDGNYFAIGDNYALRSSDGTNWTASYLGFVSGYALAHGNGTFAGVGPSGEVVTSTDGTNWATTTAGPQNTFLGLTFFNGAFVAVGSSGTVLTSTNGTNWAAAAGGFPALHDLARFDDLYYAVGDSGQIITSSDAAHWTNLATPTTSTLYRIGHGNSTFVAVGDFGTILSSSDGVTWRRRTSGVTSPLPAVAFGSGLFLAPCSGAMLFSTNGTNWSYTNVAAAVGLTDVTFAQGLFVAVGSGGKILTSPDGFVWTPRASGTTQTLQKVIYTNGLFLAAGYALAMSADGANWTSFPGPNGALGLAYADGMYVAVGANGSVWSSMDATNWVSRSAGAFYIPLWSVVAADGLFTAVGAGGAVLQANASGLNGLLRLTRAGAATVELTGNVEIGKPYSLEWSADLHAWNSLLNFTSLQSAWQFFDSPPAADPRRFYRLVPQ